MMESGRPTSIRLTEEHYARLDALVAERRTNRSEVVRHLIDTYAVAKADGAAPECLSKHRNWTPALGGKVRRCDECGCVSRNQGRTWEKL